MTPADGPAEGDPPASEPRGQPAGAAATAVPAPAVAAPGRAAYAGEVAFRPGLPQAGLKRN